MLPILLNILTFFFLGFVMWQKVKIEIWKDSTLAIMQALNPEVRERLGT
jgi:hypothetical protein